MAYVRKILAPEENLIGIARLHWIYVIKGLAWFLGFAFAGWAMDQMIARGLFIVAQSAGTNAMTAMLLSFSHNMMLFMMVAGLYIFFLMVIKVLVTEVGLSSRRVMLKEGLFFVKVKQVDLEEVRAEEMDLGMFGRMLGYAYLVMDCRFVGDVRMPAIENPERFMRALHKARGVTADTLSVALGRGNPVAVGIVATDAPDTPQPQVPKPTPEITPGEQPVPEVNPPGTPAPEINPPPVPHAPPSPASPPQQPESPPVQPAQPIPPPINPEPPLQPPSGAVTNISLPPEAVAQVVRQVLPQMAQQVVKEMADQGLLHPEKPANDDNDVDTGLIESFDDARLDRDDKHDLRNKMEYAIH